MEQWSDRAYAERYNTLYATPAPEFQACLDLLQLTRDDALVDFGCGNGEFLELAARLVRTAVGVDASEPQVAQARQRLAHATNVQVLHAGFLDFDPGPHRFTRGFSRKALHHLADPEKERFLHRIAPAFEPGAVFLLEDGMFFGFEREELDAHWDELVAEAASHYGDSWPAKREDVLHSFREEFPTGANRWARLFHQVGFAVKALKPRCSFYGTLLAVKTR